MYDYSPLRPATLRVFETIRSPTLGKYFLYSRKRENVVRFRFCRRLFVIRRFFVLPLRPAPGVYCYYLLLLLLLFSFIIIQFDLYFTILQLHRQFLFYSSLLLNRFRVLHFSVFLTVVLFFC